MRPGVVETTFWTHHAPTPERRGAVPREMSRLRTAKIASWGLRPPRHAPGQGSYPHGTYNGLITSLTWHIDCISSYV